MFYDKLVEIWTKGNPVDLGGGITTPGELELTKQIKVDIQPYSSAEAQMDYGLDVLTTHAMFSPVMELNIGNDVIRYMGDDYEITESIVWDDYMEVMLNRK